MTQKCSHIARIRHFGEADSRCVRMLSSENGFHVDTRSRLMTELPQILSAITNARAARGEIQ
jgi:hypothetical protein